MPKGDPFSFDERTHWEDSSFGPLREEIEKIQQEFDTETAYTEDGTPYDVSKLDEEQLAERMALPNAIENGLLGLAEAIKYAADTYAEVNAKPKEKKKVLTPEWRPAQVGDLVQLTGVGIEGHRQWHGRKVEITRIGDKGTLYWIDPVTKETGSGCFNKADRFHHVVEVDNDEDNE